MNINSSSESNNNLKQECHKSKLLLGFEAELQTDKKFDLKLEPNPKIKVITRPEFRLKPYKWLGLQLPISTVRYGLGYRHTL